MDDANNLGVYLDIEMIDNNSIWLANIFRKSGRPGSGTIVLGHLKEYADESGIAILGVIVHHHEHLAQYYQDQLFSVHPEEDRWEIRYPA